MFPVSWMTRQSSSCEIGQRSRSLSDLEMDWCHPWHGRNSTWCRKTLKGSAITLCRNFQRCPIPLFTKQSNLWSLQGKNAQEVWSSRNSDCGLINWWEVENPHSVQSSFKKWVYHRHRVLNEMPNSETAGLWAGSIQSSSFNGPPSPVQSIKSLSSW